MTSMRRSIEELRDFYGEPAGTLARRLLARRLEDAWGEANGADVLGIGYATPWLDAFVGARRVVAAMPGGQGVELWPAAGRNRTVLVDDRRLPFAAGSFDRIGGHNLLEPAALRKPVLVGPHTFNFEDITAQLIASGGAFRVRDDAELADACMRLFADADRRHAMGEAGSALVRAGQGALERTLEIASGLLRS